MIAGQPMTDLTAAQLAELRAACEAAIAANREYSLRPETVLALIARIEALETEVLARGIALDARATRIRELEAKMRGKLILSSNPRGHVHIGSTDAEKRGE